MKRCRSGWLGAPLVVNDGGCYVVCKEVPDNIYNIAANSEVLLLVF